MRKLEATNDAEEAPLMQQAVRKVRLAAAKLITILWARENSTLEVEKSSVYGSALVMPQLARSAEWPKELIQLTIRSYILLFLAIFLQGFLVMLLNKEEAILDKFSGQMYLCDLGAHMAECPGGHGCTGPGGTLYEPARLYGWAAWVTRNYVRDSMNDVFPDMEDEINAKIDPGEFGVESHPCRLICCFLFVISLTGEMEGIKGLWNMIWYLPNNSDSWMTYEVPDWDEDKQKAKALRGYSELDLIKLQVAGMPRFWKVVNFVLLLIPKCLVWLSTLRAGTNFLMETSGINSTIVNSTALAFILNIDEMLFTGMSTNAAQYILDKVEGLKLQGVADVDNLEDDEALEKHNTNQKVPIYKTLTAMVPPKLMVALTVACFTIWYYYYDNCITVQDGPMKYFVSKDMYLPKTVDFGPLEAFFPKFFQEEVEDKPYWSMPDRPDHGPR